MEESKIIMPEKKSDNEKYFNENKVVGCTAVSIILLSISVILFLIGIGKLRNEDFTGNIYLQGSIIVAMMSAVFTGFAILLKINPMWFKKD